MQIDLELEAEFDAQAFAKNSPDAVAAIHVKIQDNTFMLAGVVRKDSLTGRESFEQRVKPLLVVSESQGHACFILFRTATWTLMTFAPHSASDSAVYLQRAPDLLQGLGGNIRIPHEVVWHSVAEVNVDDSIFSAPALSY